MTSHMATEARSIPAVAAAALATDAALFHAAAARIRAFDPAFLVTVARGSSDNAAEYIGRLAGDALGLVTASLPPSLVTVERAPLRLGRALTLAVSQSGRSPDVVQPVRLARERGGLTVALVNDTNSPLADAAEIVLPIAAGVETAVAATKSYILAMIQGARLVAHIAQDAVWLDSFAALPPSLERAIAADWSAGLAPLDDVGAIMCVSRGLGFPVAREIALKLKETCAIQAEAVSGAEIMHGPKALIGPATPLLALRPDDAAAGAMDQAMHQLTGITRCLIAIASQPMAGAAITLPLPPSPRPEFSAIIAATAAYPFIEALSLRRGLSPDAPPNLQKITETT
jgi:glutamine---fructose-6-phosphate transaminase (isomerizing)